LERIVGNNAIEDIAKILPYLRILFNNDIWVGIVENDKYIAIEPSKTFHLVIQLGDTIRPGSGVHKAIKDKVTQVTVVPREVWGLSVRTLGIPVFNENNEVIGGIGIASSLDKEDKLNEIVNQFSSAFQQVNSSVQDISAGAENLAIVGQGLTQSAHLTINDVKRTDQIIAMIQQIADQTKLLGLNAAIESARAGEHGRGFSVVAEEIRRLSEQSNKSAKQVKEILSNISESINTIDKQTQETSAVSEQQSSSTQEIAATMQELSAQLETLQVLMAELLN
jgi:uncharacterized phage infection (PIP) family protein YhgE